MPLLDTTALIDLARATKSRHFPSLISLIDSLIGQNQTIHTSRINEGEFRVGAFLATDQANEIRKIERVLAAIVILEFNGQAALHYAQIQAHLIRAGRRTGTADTFIAAVAMANAQSIVTRNPRDFANIPGLAVLSY